MAASLNRSSTRTNSSGLFASLGDSAPYLATFTICLLLLLYGYEMFNFSLSIDEELFASKFTGPFWLWSVEQGRWTMGLLNLVFPPMGNLPMISTVLFCASLGLSGCGLARVLFRKHSAQWAFAGIFVSSPLWPHVGEFNTISWCFGIACILLLCSLLFFLSERKFGSLWAACFLALATGIYQTFFAWFLVLVCVRHLSVLLGTAPVDITDPQKKFPWLRSLLVAVGALSGYVIVEKIFLAGLSVHLTYVQDFIRLADFTTLPAVTFPRTLWRCWGMLGGADTIFLGYGHVLTLLTLLGLLIVVAHLLVRKSLNLSQRILGGGLLAAALLAALSPIIASAGIVPIRGLTSWIPISAFLAGVALSTAGRFDKILYATLAITLFISIWVSVTLFNTDHIARQRDQVLATRIMARVDQLLTDSTTVPMPFVVIGAPPAKDITAFQRAEVFGDSFFDTSHEGGNPWRVAAYLRTLGVDTLEPRPMADAAADRDTIAAMPVWPASGSIAIVNGMLVIKLGALPPA